MTSPTTQQQFSPTQEQSEVAQAVGQASAGSVMVTAYAGCAKTTTLALAGKQVKVPGLVLAFNKSIAQELIPRFAGNFSVKTLNSLGLGAWMRASPWVSRFDAPDGRKLGKIVSRLAKARGIELSSDQWELTRKLVEAAMRVGIVPGDAGSPLARDTQENWWTLAEDLWILKEDFDLLFDLAHQCLEEDIEMGRAGQTSFDDQVYLPTCLGGKFPQFPFVAVDESQDLNPLNHRMLELCMRPDGRLLAVGDPKQAIYGFRGAHTSSMAMIEGLRPAWTKLPLATTFRCPKAVVARQQSHAPGFQAWHTNAEGRVEVLQALDEMAQLEGWSAGDLFALLPRPDSTLAVLCRNNAPLLSLAFKLLRGGTGVLMLGRDIGKGLVALSRKISSEDGLPIDLFCGLLTEWMEGEVSLAEANDQRERVASITDKGECLRAVASNAGVRDAGQLRQALAKLFSRESGQIALGSIHRSKGLEWDVVVHLDPWRIPSKFAKEASLRGDKRQLEQEFNLRYVCETRTRNVLAEANLEDFNGG